MNESPKPLRVAIYARYSSDKQRETSIEDQIRRSKETEECLNLNVGEWLIFTDSALSGQAHAQEKQKGQKALERAWDNNAFDILILDASERLTRYGVENEMLIERIKANRRIRLITADGIDTHREGWELLWRLKSAVAQAEISGLQHRVGRGMVGQLERGFMIATPPFGYDYVRKYDDSNNCIGTHWVINPMEAKVVQEVFERRKAGQSMQQIAEWLNAQGIPTARMGRKEGGGYWRPSRIRNLLSNTIYRGEFVWHGSTTYRNRAEKRGDKVIERRYPRPELRLVSDETFALCSTKTGVRGPYGGGKHALAGLITCGCCGGMLVLTAKSRCRSLYCANCTVAKACAEQTDRLTVTVAAAGVQTLLTEALQVFLTPDFVKAFRQSLNEKLTAGSRHEYDSWQKEFKRLERVQARLAHMLANVDEDDAILQVQYDETRRLARVAKEKLAQLATGLVEVDREAVAAQLDIEPATILAGLFDAGLPPEQLRAMLRRLFPSIVLEGKKGRYRSFFRIQFVGGAALALASKTECLIDESLEFRFMLRFVPMSGRAKKKDISPRWEVVVQDLQWLKLLNSTQTATSESTVNQS